MTAYSLTARQKKMIRDLAQLINEGKIKDKESRWFATQIPYQRMPNELATGSWKDVQRQDMLTFIEHRFFFEETNKFQQRSYIIREQEIVSAVENNFGEPIRKPKSPTPQKNYKSLNEEQWNFLSLMVTALRGNYIYPKGKKGRYFAPVMGDELITEFVGLNGTFITANRNELYISPKDFLDLVGKGYFERARNDNYYLIEERILPAVDEYLAQRDETGTPITSSAFRLPDTSAQFKCDIFMVMPFRQELNPVYADHITNVTKELGYLIKRGDDTFSHHDIITEIWSLINNARLIIADCTGKNANVFYEMGLAHAIDKPVIIITQDEEDIPFDIRQRRYIKYEYTPRGMKQFEEELKKAIQSILGN